MNKFSHGPVRTIQDCTSNEGIFLPSGSAIHLHYVAGNYAVGDWSSQAGTYTVTVPKSILDLRAYDPMTPRFPQRNIGVLAFDPDLDTVGWASIYAEVTRGVPRIIQANAGLVRTKLKAKGLDATVSMIATLRGERFGSPDHVIVEAQEIYRDGKADANDLLRLAQITGAIQALTGALPVLPKVWKGNKQKEGMHERARALFTPSQLTWEDEVPRHLRQHVWDAICMALWKVKTTAQDLDQQLLASRPLKA